MPAMAASCTRTSLKLLLWLQLLLGLAVACYGAYLVHQAGAFAPDAPPAAGSSPPPLAPAPPPPPCDSPKAEQWFVYAIFAVGGITVITQLAGLLGTRYRCCMTVFIALQCASLLAQAGFVASVYVGTAWVGKVPCPGEAERIEHFLKTNVRIGQCAVGGLLALELVALVLACCVRRNNREHERTGSWDFSDDEEMRRRPLIDSPSPSQRSTPLSPSPYGTPMGSTPARAGPSATPASSAAAADERWSQRMREMYGLDTTQYSYVPRDEAPGRAEEGGHTDGGRGAARAGCAVM